MLGTGAAFDIAEHKDTEYTSDNVILDGTYACNDHVVRHALTSTNMHKNKLFNH